MKKIVSIFIFLSSFLFADISDNFPQLTNRVVDEVKLLNQEEKNSLIAKLNLHEKETSNQIVVVILNTLNGYEIADFSYQLGRHWGIGQKDKDNGVLLVISKKEKKLRIEVGYGLEGVLTDKISHEIINYTLKPNFKTGHYFKGINSAIDEIIQAIKGEYEAKTSTNSSLDKFDPFLFFVLIFISIFITGIASKNKNLLLYKISSSTMFSSFFSTFAYAISSEFTKYSLIVTIIVFILIFIFNFLNTKKIPKASKRLRNSINYTNGGFSGGSFTGGFSNSGSFSGGGGSFGGGGASGGW